MMPEIKTQILAPGAGFGLRVKVFDTPAFDGQISGTPHVHNVVTDGMRETFEMLEFLVAPPFDAISPAR